LHNFHEVERYLIGNLSQNIKKHKNMIQKKILLDSLLQEVCDSTQKMSNKEAGDQSGASQQLA
jgi:hypothetical protein